MAFDTNSDEVTAQLLPSGKRWNPLDIFFENFRNVLKADDLGREIAMISLPAILALTADPLASLVDTAFVGQIGPVELASIGVSIAIFNQVSKVFNFPLVSVTTSLVAEENVMCAAVVKEKDTEGGIENGFTETQQELVVSSAGGRIAVGTVPEYDADLGSKVIESATAKKIVPSVSSALVIGGALGIIQGCIMIIGAKPILHMMGIHSESPMEVPAKTYLELRAIGAPAVVILLTTQGVFRGFKDTRTPLYATMAGNIVNIILNPILIFLLRFGVSGAAIATIASQYLAALLLLWNLHRRVVLLPPRISDLHFGPFLKNGFLLLARVTAVTLSMTLATSMAARQGPVPMAATQICMQIWLATSLLADGLAFAGQAILASAFGKGDYSKAKRAASRTLQIGIVFGFFLAAMLGGSLGKLSTLFTNDARVLDLMHIGIPFVAATQPINSLAFVFDGIHFGASDFAYAAYTMIAVSIITMIILVLLSPLWGFIGVWTGLTIMMTLRTIVGVWRVGAASGPWRFLRN